MNVSVEDRGWLAPPQQKKPLPAGLYLVATPIGNLGDITLRALDTLAGVDRVLCEDTRVSGKLLSHYGIKTPRRRYDDHSTAEAREAIIADIAAGQRIALISDAGTPLIADPGYKLVQDCYEAGLAVTTLPGASATLSALQLSGLPSDAFSFIGFLPSKQGARTAMLEKWQSVDSTLIAYETGPRLCKTLADIDALYGLRAMAVTREMTKLYEEARRGSASDLLAHYADNPPKGEIVLVISPPEEGAMDEAYIVAALEKALAGGMRTKDAAAHVAKQSGWAKKDVYDLALKVQSS